VVEDAPVGLLQCHLGDLGAPDKVGGVVLGADRVDLLHGPVDEGRVGRGGGVVGRDIRGEERSPGGAREEHREGGVDDSHGRLSSRDCGERVCGRRTILANGLWRLGMDAILYTSEDKTDRGVVVSSSAFQWVDAMREECWARHDGAKMTVRHGRVIMEKDQRDGIREECRRLGREQE
jgi:hypothetical protein